MIDYRVEKLAELLVGYSTPIKPGQKAFIYGGSAGEPLMIAIARRVLLAGGHPAIFPTLPGYEEMFFKLASDEQLKFVHYYQRNLYETYDARYAIHSESNTKSLSNIEPDRMVTFGKARADIMKTFMDRSAKKELGWSVVLFPTQAHAQQAEMSLSDYEDFVYNACMPDMNDPVGYWKRVSAEQQKICDWLKGKKTVHVTGRETDLTLSIEGRTFENCDCHENVPDGEIFTGPVENSMNGQVYYSYPAIYSSREVTGVRLWFENGKVVKATADKNEDFLTKTLDTDTGARYVGEFAIGTNNSITRFTGELLFDEKIGGSFHMAVGAGYPETGSKNESSVHWDMICDLREGGEITVDGLPFYKNGKFILDLK
jgi:aminopeptidase